MTPKKIGIIGAGPAGAWLAYRLAQAGLEVLIYDHKVPWEKPCAGGLSSVLWGRFPELDPLKSQGYPNRKFRIVTVLGEKLESEVSHPLYTVTRKRLGRFLMDKAASAGAEFSPAKVDNFTRNNNGVELIDNRGGRARVDFMVGADGVSSLVRRKLCGAWASRNFNYSLSVLIPKPVSVPLTFQFFSGLAGYTWIFPGIDSTSIGIGAKAGRYKAETLFSFLAQMVSKNPELSGLNLDLRAEAVAALIPSLTFSSFLRQKVVGEYWALAGDASGAAHPVSGGGIHNAIFSANLLADSIISGNPRRYQQDWRRMCRQELTGASLWGPIFYRPGMQKLFSKMIAKSEAARALTVELLPGGRPKRTAVLLKLLKAVSQVLI